MDEKKYFGLKDQVRKIKLYALSLVNDLYQGGYRSSIKGQGLEFSETRPYLLSDEVRFIDWNVTARLGEPFVKTFKEEKEFKFNLIVDNSLSLYSGSSNISKKEITDFLVVVFAYIAQFNNDSLGVTFFDKNIQFIPSKKGNKHVNHIIQATISRELGKGSDLSKALRGYLESSRRRTLVIIISDFRMDGYYKDLAILSKYHDLLAIRLKDDLDEELPNMGFAKLKDPETQEEIGIWGIDKISQKRYHDLVALQRIKWRKECIKRNIPFLEVDTKEDYLFQVKRFLKNQGKRKR